MLVIVAGFLLEAPEAFCKSKGGPVTLLTRADQCRKVLHKSSKKMKYRHNWLKCIRLYKKVYKVYPKSNQAVWALYHSANLYTGLYRYSGRSKDLNEALALYRRLAGKHKGHPLADDAQYKIGGIYYKFKKDPRSEERREGKSVDLGGRRIIKKKKRQKKKKKKRKREKEKKKIKEKMMLHHKRMSVMGNQ